ncbi:cyclic nucleotide-binding domain-containing protein [Nocardioides sp.]|uniref:cyclic nucleotide-binding domain-containing protein n=1 Tax=Nocardioides sp. TaxID=35761 RepID=UPI0035114879
MAHDPKTARLAALPLFAGCSPRELDHLAPLLDEVRVAAGTVLVREGAVDPQAFLLLSGSAEVSVDGVVVAHVGPGELVGEMSLLHGRAPRTATVTAVGPVEAFVLTPRGLSSVLEQAPTVAARIEAEQERRRGETGRPG